MLHPVSPIADAVRAALGALFGPELAGVDPAVHRSSFADYQVDVALRLAKSLKRSPLDLAGTIAERLDLPELLDGVKVSPPGFINLTLKQAYLEGLMGELSHDPRAGVEQAGAPETVVVDYSSPNVAKEMHVGHLRSTVIGDSLVRLFELMGHRVIRQNHVGDWGTPFGMLIEHLLGQPDRAQALERALGDPNHFYQEARKKFDGDSAFAERSRHRVVLLQSGDAETRELWESLVETSRRYFRRVYAELGVLLTDDDLCGESFYADRLPKLAEELEQKGLARVDDGALGVFLEDFAGRDGTPTPLIVRKRDGGFGYAATDLAALRYRTEELGATRILYVMGAPQQRHLAMVFATAKLAGWLPDSVRAEQVAFGSVLDSGRKMLKTRVGDSVQLVDLLKEAVERAELAVAEKNPELDPEERRAVARSVGIGAIKYADLSTERIKDYVFDWSRMLSFEGDTGPYLQYAHARISSILRRGAEQGSELSEKLLGGNALSEVRVILEEPAERALALELLDLRVALDQVLVALQPHRLAAYLYELATRFSAFYEACPVLKAPTAEVRDSRLLLAACTRRALSVGLEVLGIVAPERM